MTKAPNFTLFSDENKLVSLSDFHGKKLLIFFFPKAATPGCTAQACGFRDNFPKITEHNATVIGISGDSPEALAKWKADEHLPYTLLSDPQHEIAKAYGVWEEKSMFGNKYMGIVRSHFVVDPEGTLIVEERKVSPSDSVKKGTTALVK